MPPPPPRAPQHRNTDPFDDAELGALYSIDATAPSSGLVAALWGHVQDVNLNRVSAMVLLLHAATTDIFVRQLQTLITPGTQITDDLVDAWIWWFNTHQPDQGGIWVPHLGGAHTLIAPLTDPRPTPSIGGRKRAAPPPGTQTLNIPRTKTWQNGKAGQLAMEGRKPKSMVERYPEQRPNHAKVTPAPSP